MSIRARRRALIDISLTLREIAALGETELRRVLATMAASLRAKAEEIEPKGIRYD